VKARGPRRPAANLRSVNYATSPLLAARTPPGRSRFVVALVALAFLGLAARAVWVQVVNADFYRAEGAKRFLLSEDLPAVRGRIVDRQGQLLAASVPAPSIAVNPRAFEADAAQRKALARLLDMPVKELEQRVAGRSQFAYLRRFSDEATWDQVRTLGIKGLMQRPETRRSYPEGEASAHIVGFTNLEEQGLEGIERQFDATLRGHDGQRAVVRDRLGRIVEDIGDAVDPVPGQDLQLSIDAKIQSFAYQRLRDAVRAHDARGGSAVVLDTVTGEVLALANYPSYDPERRRNLGGGQMRNRALTDLFEPGSTMKPFTIALALERGLVTPSTRIDTGPGYITVTGSTIRDTKPHGVLTVEQVLQKSSNVGTVKLAMQMKPREMWELFSQVGMGHKPAIEFPGAATGRLRAAKTWRPVEQATMSYGYGLSTSLLQLARAYTVFANDGTLLPLTLLKRDAPAIGEPVLKPETARAMRAMLAMATTSAGTAPLAQTVGYSVAGKTGTVRKQEGKGYSMERYRSWFVGFAPAGQPRIVVAVMVDEPRKGGNYGGVIAAPVFSQVAQQTLRVLGVAPDIEVKPLIVNGTGEEESV